ncbi:MAG: N-formylglutamate amidohydrolase [Cyanobacteria bacterium J06606_4]
MPADVFTLRRPQGTALPVVANFPHSGTLVPADIASQFTPAHLQALPNSDWHLPELYSFLPSLGVTTLQANYSRYVVDLNRALKPPLFGSFWSAVVPEHTAFKAPIYRQPVEDYAPSEAAVRSRIDQYYTPYHQQLEGLLNDAIARHGTVYLLDLHSFMGLITDDVCLGNANGETCRESLLMAAAESFRQQNYQVVQNKVFTGGHITRHYGKRPNIQALQIEIRYPTYLPEDQLETSHIPQWQGPTFEQARVKLRAALSQLFNTIQTGEI